MPQPVKQPINIDFQKGLNLKVDPYQVSVGFFLSLVNTVFDKVGRLTKRFGFPFIAPTLPDPLPTTVLTTFNGDLTAIGNTLQALSTGTTSWVDKGTVQPVMVSTLPLIRNNLNQIQCDTQVSSNGLVCTAWAESDGTNIITKFAVADVVTGQNIVPPTAVVPTAGTVAPPGVGARVYILGNYFIVMFVAVIGGTNHIQYTPISIHTGFVGATVNVTSTNTNGTVCPNTAVVANNTLYLTWSGQASGKVSILSISSTLAQSGVFVVDNRQAVELSITADTTQGSPIIYISYTVATDGYVAARNSALIQILAPTQWATGVTFSGIVSSAQNGLVTIFYETLNNYSYDSGIRTDFIKSVTVTQTGTVGTPLLVSRSVGLVSNSFIVDGTIYLLVAYQSDPQSTYFLINSTGQVVAKLAYQNGAGYGGGGLGVTVIDNTAYISYLIKDLIEAVNKNTNVPVGTTPGGVYTQTGINLAKFVIGDESLTTVETANDLHLSGGFLWMYDGYSPVEHNFFVYPDNVECTWHATGGHISAQPDGATNLKAYWYQVVYVWTDNQGNVFRSAPSIPVPVTTTGTGVIGSITVNVPTLRLTYKRANAVKIEIYRWSVAQQSYYEVTSVSSPTLNNPTVDSIAFLDTLSDASILGNTLLYTTGGVVEDVGAPATNILSLFDDRLWLVDAEDPNLLWFSKQVIETTPVEMSDLFTLFISPTVGAQGSTGNITALYPMDDKLIIFKKDAIYYINGSGPDNTGANNQYSQPIFITATVGCSNTRSLVMTPNGLMFQSDKGIWLLGRDMSTEYIGAAVEDFNSDLVTSALAIPATNQVRFGLASGATLMYDYFVGQWGEFQGIGSISATLYQGMHTIINKYGKVSQEKPNTYLDGTEPVLMSFSTSWLQLAGLRGYMRAYWFYFLGTFLSPHKLNVSVAYDYNSSATQSDLVIPGNYTGPYGADPYYGGSGFTPYGGPSPIEQQRVFLERQRCKAFQISIEEVFDPTFGTVAGPGLTLSGLNCIVGVKKPYAPIPSNQQVG